MQVEQASLILNEIMTSGGVIPDSEWERFVLSSRGLYVKVMRKLRDIGLVEKRMGDYRIANDFSKALSKISTYWNQIVESYNEGDHSIVF
jgi:hypothetical protein